MATSRTGTSVHKRMAREVTADAQARGITHCPSCGHELDYEDRRSTHGAQADETTPYAATGTTSTDPSQWQVLCAQCNQRKGARNWAGTDGDNPWPQSRQWLRGGG